VAVAENELLESARNHADEIVVARLRPKVHKALECLPDVARLIPAGMDDASAFRAAGEVQNAYRKLVDAAELVDQTIELRRQMCNNAGNAAAIDFPQPNVFRDAEFFAEHVIYTPFVFLLLAPAVFGDERRDPVRRFLAWRPIAYVGMISYSFYLYHFVVIVQVARWWEAAGWGSLPQRPLEWIPWLIAGYAGTIALGSLSFHFIEKPFMNLKYRSRRPAAVAQAKAAP